MSTNGHKLDRGVPEGSAKLCAKTTWCKEPPGHDGPCVEVVSTPPPPGDYGPGRARPKK